MLFPDRNTDFPIEITLQSMAFNSRQLFSYVLGELGWPSTSVRVCVQSCHTKMFWLTVDGIFEGDGTRRYQLA